MGLPYTPKKLNLPSLASLDETTDLAAQNKILRATIEALMTWINTEMPRIATATNSAAGVKAAFRTTMVDTNASSTDGTIAGDTSGGDVLVTLPLTSEYPGLTLTFKESVSGNTMTVATRGADTINSTASITVTTPVTYQADSVTSNWELI